MAATAFNSAAAHRLSLCRHRRHSANRITPTTPTFFLKPPPTASTSAPSTPSASISHSASASATPSAASASSSPPSASSSPPSASKTLSFDLIRTHLASKNFRDADEETRRLLIVLAGDAALKRGYVFFSEVQFIAEEDMRTLDRIWAEHSGGKFGYVAQKKIWEKSNRDFTKFFIRVGWMKKLEALEVEQYNYRSFPGEFMWEMEEGTPVGHLPLTNALRGTQLLNSILTHPAFDDEDGEGAAVDGGGEEERKKTESASKNRIYKTSYTF